MKSQENYLGKIVSRGERHIDQSTLKRFAQALTYHENIFKNFDNTLPISFLSCIPDLSETFTKLKIDPNKILHTQESIVRLENIRANDTISYNVTLSSIHEQQGQNCPLGFLELHIQGTIKRKLIFKLKRMLVVRGGFTRRK